MTASRAFIKDKRQSWAAFPMGLAIALSFTGDAFAGSFRERLEQRRAERERVAEPQQSGVETLTITHDGEAREALILQPSAAGSGPLPIILALHGGTRSNADIFGRRSGWPAIAREEGAILAAPNAIGGNWNDGRTIYQGGFNPTGIDDAGYLIALIDRLIADYGGDPQRVYVTGASNGGNMSWRLACEHGGRIAAIGPMLSTMPGDAGMRCADAPAMPVIAFFGTEDQFMRYDGQPVRTRDGRLTEPRLSAAASTDWWASRNGCTLPGEAELLPDLDMSDGTTVQRIAYACPATASVVRYDVIGGGHIQPGPPPVPGVLRRILGAGSGDIAADATIWAFFTDQRRPQ